MNPSIEFEEGNPRSFNTSCGFDDEEEDEDVTFLSKLLLLPLPPLFAFPKSDDETRYPVELDDDDEDL